MRDFEKERTNCVAPKINFAIDRLFYRCKYKSSSHQQNWKPYVVKSALQCFWMCK